MKITLLLQRKICESSTITLFPLLTEELMVNEIVAGSKSWHSGLFTMKLRRQNASTTRYVMGG